MNMPMSIPTDEELRSDLINENAEKIIDHIEGILVATMDNGVTQALYNLMHETRNRSGKGWLFVDILNALRDIKIVNRRLERSLDELKEL
jgi:hypothetical protein